MDTYKDWRLDDVTAFVPQRHLATVEAVLGHVVPQEVVAGAVHARRTHDGRFREVVPNAVLALLLQGTQ